MKTGIDFIKGEVFVSLDTGNSLTTTVNLSTDAARALADALTANAQCLEQAFEDGWPKKELEVPEPPEPADTGDFRDRPTQSFQDK